MKEFVAWSCECSATENVLVLWHNLPNFGGGEDASYNMSHYFEVTQTDIARAVLLGKRLVWEN